MYCSLSKQAKICLDSADALNQPSPASPEPSLIQKNKNTKNPLNLQLHTNQIQENKLEKVERELEPVSYMYLKTENCYLKIFVKIRVCEKINENT